MKLVSVPAILALCVVLPSLTFAQGPASGGADKARLTKLEKEFNVAKAKLAKSPKDKKLQKSFVDLGALYGHESMMSPVLPSKVKYRQALHIYREVLKVDPKNPVAKQDSDQIISIYQSMGRPIPKD